MKTNVIKILAKKETPTEIIDSLKLRSDIEYKVEYLPNSITEKDILKFHNYERIKSFLVIVYKDNFNYNELKLCNNLYTRTIYSNVLILGLGSLEFSGVNFIYID